MKRSIPAALCLLLLIFCCFGCGNIGKGVDKPTITAGDVEIITDSAETSATDEPAQSTIPPETDEPVQSDTTAAATPDARPGTKPAERETVPSRATPAVVRPSIKIAIDAGHQQKGNNELEPTGPGSSESKPKVAGGTAGVSTKIPEYELTLAVSLKLKDELIARGYDVYMIRETNDVDISNRERAAMADEAGADIFVRIHANGSDNANDNGTLTISPTKNNPYIPHLYDDCHRLSELVLSEMIKVTNAKSNGIWETDTMSGINWSPMPVTIVEMGYMTNAAEDELMQTEAYQSKLVTGIANGIDLFFRGN